MKIFQVFVLLITTILLCGNIYGQKYLLTEITVDTTVLDSTQLANYQRSERSPYLTNHRFVSYHHLHEVQENGAVRLAVSLSCDSITFFAESVEYQDSSNFYWYGMAKHNADTATSICDLGDFMILCDNSRLIGHMTIDTQEFELTHLGDTICLLSVVVDSMFTELECNTRYCI